MSPVRLRSVLGAVLVASIAGACGAEIAATSVATPDDGGAAPDAADDDAVSPEVEASSEADALPADAAVDRGCVVLNDGAAAPRAPGCDSFTYASCNYEVEAPDC